jgi:hypothetical protein
MIRRSAVIAAVSTASLLAGGGLTAASQAKPIRHGGRVSPPTAIKTDSGTGYFSITHDAGSLEYTAGNVNDKVFGTSAITYDLKLAPGKTGSLNIKATKVVLYTAKGSLSGTATATINNLSATTQTITNGKLTLDKGQGALKGDNLTAKFSGTANITKNQFVFKYKGLLQI